MKKFLLLLIMVTTLLAPHCVMDNDSTHERLGTLVPLDLRDKFIQIDKTQIIVGETTEEDVFALFGPPTSIDNSDNNSKKLKTYTYFFLSEGWNRYCKFLLCSF